MIQRAFGRAMMMAMVGTACATGCAGAADPDPTSGQEPVSQAAEAALLVGATSEAAGYWRTAVALLGDDPAAEEYRARIRGLESVAAARAGSVEEIRPA